MGSFGALVKRTRVRTFDPVLHPFFSIHIMSSRETQVPKQPLRDLRLGYGFSAHSPHLKRAKPIAPNPRSASCEPPLPRGFRLLFLTFMRLRLTAFDGPQPSLPTHNDPMLGTR